MTKARDLADLIAAGSGLADGTVEVADISDLTATAAELNYVSGVTSAVQTQLDSKASTAGGTFSGDIDVTGTVTADGLNIDGTGVITGTNGETLRLAVTSDAGVQHTFGLGFATGSNTHPAASILAKEFDASDSRASLSFSTRATNSDVAPLERLLISDSGDISFYEDTGTTPKFFWDASAERLGIGTSSPSSELHVASNSPILTLQDLDSAEPLSTYISFNDSGGNVHGWLGYGSSSFDTLQVTNSYEGISFRTGTGGSSSERMHIDASGNVGIGTNPAEKLDVSGVTLSSSVQEGYTALSGTTPSIDADTAGSFALTTSGNTTFTFAAVTSGRSVGFVLKVTAGGAHTLTWPASVDWPGGTAPDAPASGETDVLVFITHDGGTTWYGFLAGDALA